jgi:osomolarity two-component system response regulator SKN7
MAAYWRTFEQVTSGQVSAPNPIYGYSNPTPQPTYPSAEVHRISADSIVQPSPYTDESRKSLDTAHARFASRHSACSAPTSESTEGMPERTSDDVDAAEGIAQETPVYAETPAWLTKGVTIPMPMYHRKGSEGIAFRLMMDALGVQGNAGGASIEGVDPLDLAPSISNRFQSIQNGSSGQTTRSPLADHAFPQTATAVTPFAFNASSLPSELSDSTKTRPKPKGKAQKVKGQQKAHTDFARRRSSVITPHWNKTPRILVVEDDMVYRQLSSKFLEKFGCVVETVENAQEAITVINHKKYDLVLMDIFFGPSMDG